MEKIDKRTREYRELQMADNDSSAGTVVCTDADTCPHGIPIEMADNCYGCRMTKARTNFDHCPGCGAELLDDEKSSTCAAHCHKCVYKEY